MDATIQIKLFATLAKFLPPDAQEYPIARGQSVRSILSQLNIPTDAAKLIFIDGVRRDLDAKLSGGERVGIFPPVGGG